MIRGDIYDDVAEYFERQFEYFDDDVRDLETTGFGDIARELRDLKVRLFGDARLTRDVVDDFIESYYEDEEGELHDELEGFSERLRPRFDDLQDYRDALGLQEKFYRHLEW